MKNFGLSEKELRQIINNIHPDGWIKVEGDKKKSVLVPSEKQLEAVRIHLESLYVLEKRKEYLRQLVERLRPEVESKSCASGREA